MRKTNLLLVGLAFFLTVVGASLCVAQEGSFFPAAPATSETFTPNDAFGGNSSFLPPNDQQSGVTPASLNAPESDLLQNLPTRPFLTPSPPSETPEEPSEAPKSSDRPKKPPKITPFSCQVLWFPSVGVQGQSGKNFEMVAEDVSLAYPVFVSPQNSWLATANVRYRWINTDAILPDTHQRYPDELWDVHIGLKYQRQLGDGWVTGGGITFGSASDHPFASIHEMDIGGTMMLKVPHGDRDTWTFAVMYMPTSEFNFPIPAISYNYNPSEQFQMDIGIPTRITYRPTEQWQLEAMYVPIRTVHVKSTYHLTERLSVIAAYDWANESYQLHDRVDDSDRFYLYDQRVSLGLQMEVAPKITASVAGGYSFDRYSYEGEGGWKSSDEKNRVNLDSGAFGMLSIEMVH